MNRRHFLNPDYIIPMHCTGLNTIIAVHMAMPAKLVMPSTGAAGRLRRVTGVRADTGRS